MIIKNHIVQQLLFIAVIVTAVSPAVPCQNSQHVFSPEAFYYAAADTNNESGEILDLFSVKQRMKTSLNNKAPLSVNPKPDKPSPDLPASLMLPDGTFWNNQTEVNTGRMLGILGGVLTVGTFGYFRLKDLQYDHPTTKFHTTNFKLDLKIYQQMDKYGHFTHAYFASDLLTKLYRWSGFSGESSIWYGTLTGWLWILQIEIADAFFEEWGFSWGDLIANTLGSGFSALQQFYPEVLGGIQPKISYTPSDALKERRWGNGAKAWMDDYEGITWWLGVNIYHYMPEKIQRDYPDWLKPFGIAIGQSAQGIANNAHGGKREIYLGLDFDLRKIPFGDESGLIRFLKSELNIIKLPMPAVRLSPGGIWYGLYF